MIEFRSRRASALSLLLLLHACERADIEESGASEDTRLETAQDHETTPDVIDADWVASKFQSPPPPEEKDWLREIEKDPIAALKQMDPGALQPRGGAPTRAAGAGEFTSSGPRKPRNYEPNKPLKDWPPSVGQFYPDLILKDQTGQITAISDFRGKVILLEVVGLTCRACHAFAGGNDPGRGRFHGIQPQPGLPSIERYAKGYAKLSLDHPDIVFVQLVLYGLDGQSAPAEKDVQDWATHFGMNRNLNEVVLIGDARFISPETRALIPGFHLIDQNGILRAMSSNNPQHDRLDKSLLPKLASLVQDGR